MSGVYGDFLENFLELREPFDVWDKEDASDIRQVIAVYMPNEGGGIKRRKYTSGNTGLDIDTLIFGGPGDPTMIQNLGSDDIGWAITYSDGGERVIQKLRVYAAGGELTDKQKFLFDSMNERVKRETSDFEVISA